MTRDEVIQQLCGMMGRVWSCIDPDAHHPCDCVCRNKGMWNYQNAGHALEFMEKAISEAIANYSASAEATCKAEDPNG